MIDRKTLAMAWALLDAKEKRQFWGVLLIVVLSAASASFMVASIMPFLTVLADSARIHDVPLLSFAYESGGFESDRSFLFVLGLASIAVIILANLVQILRVYAVMRFALMRTHSISYRLMASYLRQPYTYFLSHHSSVMGTQVLSESYQVVAHFFRPALEGIASLITLLALLGLLLYVNPAVTLGIAAVFCTLYGGTLLISQRAVKRLGIERAEANASRHRIANEAFGGIKELRLLGREKAYLDRYFQPSLRMGRSMARVNVIQQIPRYIMQACVFSGLIILCLVLLGMGDSTQAGVADILPTIGLIGFAGQRMIPELSQLYQSLTKLAYGGPAVRTVYKDMVEHRGGIELADHSVAPTRLRHDIIFDGVSYHYGTTTDSPALANISLSIRAGESIGIVGKNGAGKSSLANILMGLIEPTEGCIRVDGHQITPGNIRNWQRSICYVPQETFLVDASIRENIALGIAPDEIDDAQIIRVARVAQLHDFIVNDLEHGYDSRIGERGVRLSGGQRQRIGIARGLYDGGDLIVLDEASSALDTVAETELMKAIDQLCGDKTLIMIAHRLTTLRNCDRILVLEKGAVAAFGTWDELYRGSESFRRLSRGVAA